jgi:hypothetical protein
VTFSAPLGLLALLAVPAVLALHLLRRRRRERHVAALFLFLPDRRPADAGRVWQPLRRSASLFAELTAALALAGLASGVRCSGAADPPHLVVVLDDSASMGAVGPGGSVVERARAVVQARLDDLPRGGTVTVLRSGGQFEIVAGPRVPARAAREALVAWVPVRPAHELGRSLDLAVDLAGPRDPILLVTDRPLADAPDRVEVAALGVPLDNVAIASARRLAAGEREALFADLVAYGRARQETEIVAVVVAGTAEREVWRQAVSVEPGRVVHASVELPRSDLPVRLALRRDALAVDDEVLLLPEPPRVVTLATALSEAAARSLGIDRLVAALPDVRRVDDPSTAALVIGAAGAGAGGGGSRLDVAPIGNERDDWIGPFVAERRHPLLAGTTLEGIVWSAGRGSMPGRPLVFAGDQPLVTEAPVPGGHVWRLNLDPGRSTLTASPDWPILVSNVVERVRSALPGPGAVNLRLDEPMVYRHDGDAAAPASFLLVAPSGRTEPARGLRLFSWEAREPGLHRLTFPGGDLARYGVQFADAQESNLLAASTSTRLPQDGPVQGGLGPAASAAALPGRLETRILALLLLAALVADAWFVRRREGVA